MLDGGHTGTGPQPKRRLAQAVGYNEGFDLSDKVLTPPRRTRFVDAVSTGIRLARRTGLIQAPQLEVEPLLDEARRDTGLDDFGDPWFMEPFARLLTSLREEARLNEGGEWAAHAQIRKVLHDRLWAEQWFARHPEILARPLPHPVIVVGPMRSGTTRMHRLLAADHRFTHLRSFETISPVPRPEFEHGAYDPRIDLAARIMRVARLANPRTLTIHPTGSMQPEEELGLFVRSFWGMKHDAQWWVPSYSAWCEGQDATGAYLYAAKLLKLVGWTQQTSSLKPWILKTPQHMLDLPALLRVFPDARVIFTHRDPCQVVGSAASLAWNQTIIYSDHVDPLRVGEEWLRKTRLQIDRMMAARRAIPDERMIDVHFDEMESDWQGAMARVYDFLDLDMAPAMPAMETYQAGTSSLKRKVHQYSLEEFGLSSERVLGELGDYVRAFGIATQQCRRAATR